MSKEGFRTPAGVASSRLIALSGHTCMYFLTLRDVFLQTMNLKLDVT